MKSARGVQLEFSLQSVHPVLRPSLPNPYESALYFPVRSKPWSIGPLPFPRSSMALRAPDRYAFARSTAHSRSDPFARFDAIALESVQPVPWVLGLSIFFPLNHLTEPFLHRRSLASFRLCPHFNSTAQEYLPLIRFAAVTISSFVLIFSPDILCPVLLNSHLFPERLHPYCRRRQ